MNGKFPEFPDEDEGGSSAIFKQKTLEEVEAELNNKVRQLYIQEETLHVHTIDTSMSMHHTFTFNSVIASDQLYRRMIG